VTGILIPIRLRERVLARAAGRCAFCRCADWLMGVTFEIDHVKPRAAGGETALDNLCLCCPTCNRHKAARTRAVDPVSGKSVRLFHPVRDAWEEHFTWREGGTLVAGRTAVGRATLEALHVNRSVMVELRRYWVGTGVHPPADGDG
jgi:HNH endonuclease